MMKLPSPLIAPIDPAMAGFLAQPAGQPPMHTLPPEVVRQVVHQLSTMPGPPPAAVGDVREIVLPPAASAASSAASSAAAPVAGRTLRLYTPQAATDPTP